MFDRLLVQAIELAPPDIQAMIQHKFRETFGVRPAGYDQSGRPWYSAEQVADALGLSPDEVVELAQETGRDETPDGPLSGVQ